MRIGDMIGGAALMLAMLFCYEQMRELFKREPVRQEVRAPEPEKNDALEAIKAMHPPKIEQHIHKYAAARGRELGWAIASGTFANFADENDRPKQKSARGAPPQYDGVDQDSCTRPPCNIHFDPYSGKLIRQNRY